MEKETFVKQIKAIREFVFSDLELPEEAFGHIDGILDAYEIEIGAKLPDAFFDNVFYVEGGDESIDEAWGILTNCMIKAELEKDLKTQITQADIEAQLAAFDERLTALEQYNRG